MANDASIERGEDFASITPKKCVCPRPASDPQAADRLLPGKSLAEGEPGRAAATGAGGSRRHGQDAQDGGGSEGIHRWVK